MLYNRILMGTSYSLYSIIRWFDWDARLQEIVSYGGKGTDCVRVIPLIRLHLSCLGIPKDLSLLPALYANGISYPISDDRSPFLQEATR